MGYRILYFYKMENAFYREKKENHLVLTEKESEEPVKLFFCGIPEYYGKRIRWGRRKGKTFFPVAWNAAQLLRLMQNCCEYVSADACYLEEQFEKELAEGEFGYTPGRQRMCGELIRETTGQLRGIDGILYLGGDGEEQAGELPLPEELLWKLRYFFYLGEKPEQCAVLEENLWQEYGMPLLAVKTMGELSGYRMKRLLVLDDRPEGGGDLEMLPGRCVYLDLWSDAGRRGQVEKDRKDIKYISEYLYLRRSAESGRVK